MKFAFAELSAAANAVETERAKFAAGVWFETEQRQGLPVWGDPRPSDVAGAIKQLMTASERCNQVIQTIGTVALEDARKVDNASRELADGSAAFIVRKSLIVRRDRPSGFANRGVVKERAPLS